MTTAYDSATDTRALEFLSDLLHGGRPVLLDRVKALAAAAGISGPALRAAQRDLGVAFIHANGLPHIQMVQPRHRPSASPGLKARSA